jgi:diguanylate cyclase (GGDEF)-like protein
MIVLLIALLTAVLSLSIGRRAADDFKNREGTALAATAYMMTSRLDQYMWGRLVEVRMLAELNEFKDRQNPDVAENLLNRMQMNIAAFSWIGVTDVKGTVWAATNHILVGKSIAMRPVFQEGIKGEFIGDVHDAVLLAKLLPNPSGEPMKFVDISMPIKDNAGKTIGVLAAHLSWKWAEQLKQSMFQPMVDRRQGEIFIISRQENSVLLGPAEMLGHKMELQSVKEALQGHSGWLQEVWSDNADYITGFDIGEGYLDYKGLGWVVLIRQPVEMAHKAANRLQQFIWLLAAFFASLFAVAGWYLSGAITQPIEKLARTADRLRFGGKEIIETPKGIREIEQLADSLRELVESVSMYQGTVSKLEGIAYFDRLTGLPNRLGMDEYLAKAQAMVLRQKELVLAFLFIDLDGFKVVNDSLGHAAGDQVLVETAKRLKQNLRNEELAARIGGDEFIVVLFVHAGRERSMVRSVADRILVQIAEPIAIEQQTARIGCSIGCAFWDGSREREVVMKQADDALYRVKKSGKNRIEFAD